jgi:indole-3-glycerol phosphate synthase
MRELAAAGGKANGKAFYDAVGKPGMRFICEVKKASPSKGVIDPVFDYLAIARAYEAAGADCVSCLTEPRWFLGSDDIFRDIRGAISTPMLRKDFVVDEYQLYQAKVLGANCALLICAILDRATLARYLGICEDLGLAALTEAHDEAEIAAAVAAGARMIGVNNRNLKDFSVDLGNAARLRERIPAGRLYVAESGVKTPADAAAMKRIGADAILMGEALMRAPDKAAALAAMREATA